MDAQGMVGWVLPFPPQQDWYLRCHHRRHVQQSRLARPKCQMWPLLHQVTPLLHQWTLPLIIGMLAVLISIQRILQTLLDR